MLFFFFVCVVPPHFQELSNQLTIMHHLGGRGFRYTHPDVRVTDAQLSSMQLDPTMHFFSTV